MRLLAVLLILLVLPIRSAYADDSFSMDRGKSSELIALEKVEEEVIEQEKQVKEKRERTLAQMLMSADVTAAYRKFMPKNNSLNGLIGNPGGVYLGIDIASFLNIGLDAWSSDVDNETYSDIKEVSGKALSLSLSFPYVFNEHFLIYAGGGGRFEKIEVNPRTTDQEKAGEPENDAEFGNNSALVTGGMKLRFPTTFKNGREGSVGIEANYSRTFFAPRTDYDMYRIGIFMGWKL